MPIDSNALINSRETTDEEISELAQLSAEALNSSILLIMPMM